ncbi:uncharacterized protein E0L32_001867 [Thyridium curvatum]|uniref:Uncharacterized protein n=1 Tax=Thyridium curvatum TaxID=1093900 RepID=A0A507AM11_9PEZI|nr:uncharacterized protein E0L32_001812 [Thyridium curvatum]XP_030990003.1 uncharacterized protein E0L32_001867 [Thyridium curvatum]TPX08237.1 hypothetical protein E0L32_001812 [Thyridium curvatum]TPX08292.1 hypothetical protein E0L32_001867 [Thyridium curvatum]
MGPSMRSGSVAGRDSSTSNVGSTPFSLGVLLAIVIGGSAAVCIGGAFFCVWLSRKRAAKRRDLDYVDASEAFPHDDADSTGTRAQSPRRLQKRPSHSPEKRRSTRNSFLHSFSVPVLSPMFGNDNNFGPIRTKGGESLTRLRSSSWIDEDAIHGPKVKRHGTHGRKSIRDSWPLRSLLPGSPTVPKVQLEHHPGPYTRARSSLSASTVSMPSMPVRQLPEPPKPAHLRPADPQASMGVPYVYEDFHQEQSADVAQKSSPTRSHTRNISTDSTLSEILRSTEKRLQEGGGSGRRTTRSTISPTRSLRAAQAESGDESASWHMRSRTPSPAKSAPNMPYPTAPSHAKQLSQASANSEADSIFDAYGDSSPERNDVPTALTSPSRVRRGEQDKSRHRHVSTSSSASSTLSTVYSEIEVPGDRNRIPAVPTNMPEEVGKIIMARAAAQGDPFISSNSPGSMGRPLQMATPPRALPLHGTAPRFQPSSAKTFSSLPLGGDWERSPASKDGTKSLDATPTHSRFAMPERETSEDLSRHDSSRSQVVYPPPLRLNSTSQKFEPKSVSPNTDTLNRPGVLITSPTTPGLGLGRVRVHKVAEVVPPPHNLRPICSSPTLGREGSPTEDDTLPPLPGSPELRLIGQRKITANPASPTAGEKSPQLGRMRGSIRIVSAASSIYSQFPEETTGNVKSPVEKPSDPNWARVPLSHENKDNLQVASTIGELRRMNSAVSAYSAASSYYSATSNQDAETVPLPVLRGGGCSPSRKGGGTRRYLELGSNNNSPRSTLKTGCGLDQAGEADEQKENAPEPGKVSIISMPRIEVEMHSTPGTKRKRASGYSSGAPQFQTPRKTAKNRLSERISTAAIMEDSPGLYDRDGFLICSPPKT